MTPRYAVKSVSHALLLIGSLFVCLLLFYALASSKVISEPVLTCDSAHSWWLYSAGSREHQATSTMTWYPTQSPYPDIELTSPCARLGRDKYQFFKSLVWLELYSCNCLICRWWYGVVMATSTVVEWRALSYLAARGRGVYGYLVKESLIKQI